jgi:hypothetical protein
MVGGLTDRNLEFRRIISNTDLEWISQKEMISLSLSLCFSLSFLKLLAETFQSALAFLFLQMVISKNSEQTDEEEMKQTNKTAANKNSDRKKRVFLNKRICARVCKNNPPAHPSLPTLCEEGCVANLGSCLVSISLQPRIKEFVMKKLQILGDL